MKLARLVDERLHLTLEKLSKEPLPLKVAFRLKGIIKIVGEEYAKYDEVRKEALARHGNKKEDGSLETDGHNNVKFSQEAMNDFIKEIGELSNMEIEVPTIKLSELGDNIKITLEDVNQLEGIVIED